MKKTSITRLKNELSSILDFVKAGHRVMVLEHDRAIAQIVPVQQVETEAGEEAALAHLERAGLVRRSERNSLKPAMESSRVKLKKVVSLSRFILDERDEAR